MSNSSILNVRWLGTVDYKITWQAMRDFTDSRSEDSPDEVWLLEHPPVFTQGQNGKPEHLINPGDIPVVLTDRGGQVTYHGPGQLMFYTLVNLSRKKVSIRQFVTILEQIVIDYLAAFGIGASLKCQAPGVYVNEKKICSIGLRVRRGATYHGLAFNVAMDLSPFRRINPCGFDKLEMTQASVCGAPANLEETGQQLINYLMKSLGYTTAIVSNPLEKQHGK